MSIHTCVEVNTLLNNMEETSTFIPLETIEKCFTTVMTHEESGSRLLDGRELVYEFEGMRSLPAADLRAMTLEYGVLELTWLRPSEVDFACALMRNVENDPSCFGIRGLREISLGCDVDTATIGLLADRLASLGNVSPAVTRVVLDYPYWRNISVEGAARIAKFIGLFPGLSSLQIRAGFDFRVHTVFYAPRDKMIDFACAFFDNLCVPGKLFDFKVGFDGSHVPGLVCASIAGFISRTQFNNGSIQLDMESRRFDDTTRHERLLARLKGTMSDEMFATCTRYYNGKRIDAEDVNEFYASFPGVSDLVRSIALKVPGLTKVDLPEWMYEVYYNSTRSTFLKTASDVVQDLGLHACPLQVSVQFPSTEYEDHSAKILSTPMCLDYIMSDVVDIATPLLCTIVFHVPSLDRFLSSYRLVAHQTSVIPLNLRICAPRVVVSDACPGERFVEPLINFVRGDFVGLGYLTVRGTIVGEIDDGQPGDKTYLQACLEYGGAQGLWKRVNWSYNDDIEDDEDEDEDDNMDEDDAGSGSESESDSDSESEKENFEGMDIDE